MAAVVSTLHDVHAATEVGLLIHDPAADGGQQGYVTLLMDHHHLVDHTT